MSRYTERKSGLTIGSQNVFFFRTTDGELSDSWHAVVWARGYQYNDFTRYVPFLRTLAQQIIWTEEIEDDEYNTSLSGITLHWLNTEIGERGVEWDVRPKVESTEDLIFFRTRKSAVKFANRVDELIKGITASPYT